MKSAKPAKRRPRMASSKQGKYDRTVSADARHAEQRARFLDVATEVFASKGFAGTTVEQVIRRAGMSRRTFYEHFDGLREVLIAIYERASVVSFGLVEHQTRVEVDPIMRIRSGILAYFGAVAAYPTVAKVVFEVYRTGGPDLEMRYQLDSTRYAALLFEALAAAHAKGRLARPPSEITVFALSRGVEAVAVRELESGPLRLTAIAPEIVALVLDAFGEAKASR